MDRQLLERLDYLNYDEIPDWYRDNAYILTKYRDTNKGFKYYFYSIFKLHNETINIWSHLLGAILFMSIGIYTNFHFDLQKYWSQYICINLYIFFRRFKRFFFVLFIYIYKIFFNLSF